MEIQTVKITNQWLLHYNSLEKRVTAQNKMVPIMQINLPDDVLRHMATFLFYDIGSKVYEEKVETDLNKVLMRYIVRIAFTEETCQIMGSFYHSSIIQYRYYHSYYRFMQISFCNFCGNYIHNHPVTRCKCNDN